MSEGVIVGSGKHYGGAVGEADRDRAHPRPSGPGPFPPLDELTAWNTGVDDGIPEDKRVGEYTTKEASCISRVPLDDGPSFAAPEVHVYEIRSYNTGPEKDCSSMHAAATSRNGIVTFSGVGSHPQDDVLRHGRREEWDDHRRARSRPVRGGLPRLRRSPHGSRLLAPQRSPHHLHARRLSAPGPATGPLSAPAAAERVRRGWRPAAPAATLTP